MYRVPEPALAFGFSNDSIGAHSSRTLMLAELRLLLAACPASSDREAYRLAIVQDNVLLKRTEATRRESLRRLRELYALDARVVLYRTLRDLWDGDAHAQPLLALLCAVARDPLLRSTTALVSSVPEHEPITLAMLSTALAEAWPGRFNPATLARIGRNAASSWQQAGHLAGRHAKVRAQAECRPAAVVYALLLGSLCGERGEALFETLWCRLLDAPLHILHDQAFAASQQGWLEYRHSGTVTEISFRQLLRSEG